MHTFAPEKPIHEKLLEESGMDEGRKGDSLRYVWEEMRGEREVIPSFPLS